MSAIVAALTAAALPHAAATAGVRVVRGEPIDVERLAKDRPPVGDRVTVRRDGRGTIWIEFS